MALPKQVEQQLREVEQIEQQMAAATSQETPPVEAPPENPPAEDVAPPAQETPATPVAPVESDEQTWQQRFNTLRGKYDAEVPRLHQQVRELMQQVEAMKRPEAPAKPETPPEKRKLVTDQDVEKFGDDLIDLQRRVVQEAADAFEHELAALRAENEALKAQVTHTDTRLDTMTFEQKLALRVPSFEAVNASPGWIAWLDGYDPILRAPRRVMAQQAFDSGDVEAIADYVKLYESSVAQAQPTKPDLRSELSRQVQPTQSSTGRTPQARGATYTEAQANALFSRVANLNRSGKFDEAAQLEAEISLAYQEGRVLG